MIINLSDYRMSEELAFILENPLKILPPYFDAWNYAAKNIGSLIQNQDIFRSNINRMPVLDVERISKDHRAMRLAHLQLSTIVSAYIWCAGEQGVPDRLPASLAVPFWTICSKLGFKPGIGSHVGLALANYSLKDDSKPFDVSNLEILYFRFSPDFGNDWFFLLTIQIERDFAWGLCAILSAVEASLSNDYVALASSLQGISDTIDRMDGSLRRMAEHLDPKVFFYGFRPYFAGTTSGLYEKWGGIIFDGIGDDKPKKLIGGSGAQSATLQVFDAVLDIRHDKHISKYCVEIRDYILPEHKRFIEWVHETSRVRNCVERRLNDENFEQNRPNLTSTYNQCVEKLSEFRSRHIRIVAQFIICQKIERESGNNYKTLNHVGTGGTPIMPFLKSLRDSTRKHLL